MIELERIPDNKRRTEEELWEGFEAEHPKLLGALFGVLSKAIVRKASLNLSRRPRLADWGEYAAAIYEVMGWGAETFLKDWDEIIQVQNQATLDGSPVAQAIIKFMNNKDGWRGTSSELHAKLGLVAVSLGVQRDKAWPKSARWLWRRIKEVLPVLAAVGIEASRKDAERGTEITLQKVPRDDSSNPSPSEKGLPKSDSPGIKNENDRSSDSSPDTSDSSLDSGPDGSNSRNAANSSLIPARTQLGHADSGVNGVTGIRDEDFEQAVQKLLADPPSWLTYASHAYLTGQVAAVRRTDRKTGKLKEYRAKFRLENVCASVAGYVCGDALRWREAEPVVRAWLDEHADEILSLDPPPTPVRAGTDQEKPAKPAHEPKEPFNGVLTVENTYRELTRSGSKALYEWYRYSEEPNLHTLGRLVRAVLSGVGLDDADWLDYADVVKEAAEQREVEYRANRERYGRMIEERMASLEAEFEEESLGQAEPHIREDYLQATYIGPGPKHGITGKAYPRGDEVYWFQPATGAMGVQVKAEDLDFLECEGASE